MKLAILTEGTSEYTTLPLIYDQIHHRTKHTLLKPLKVNITPNASAAVIARGCKPSLIVANANGAHLAILVLDRETQDDCPGLISTKIESAISKVCSILPVKVVLKDRAFENWLIADLDALRASPRRFSVSQKMQRLVEPNQADKRDGYALINGAVIKDQYEKTSDSKKVMSKMRVDQAAKNSRSFRHFLHAVEYDAYQKQCKTPIR